MKRILYLALAVLTLGLTACDEDTLTVGGDVMPKHDKVTSSQAVFTINSRSVAADSVLANTNTCYLGSIVDPETRAMTTCDFLAQFHLAEGNSYPTQDRIVKTDGKIQADSCYVRLYFNNYYGDSLTTMKMSVMELDTNKVMEENVNYYSNLNVSDYVNEASPYNISMTYTLRDMTRNLTTSSTSYKGNIVVKLPAAYGTYIMNQYYTHPEYFKNSYSFIHHVCPGFYFRTTGGVGSMVNISISALDVYFRYHTTAADGTDSIADGMQRMAATEEVIQNTHISNEIPSSMLDSTNAFTYLKSPAGIYTEVTLPVADVVAGEHYSDTINSASVSFNRYLDESESDYTLSPPSSVLMVRKADLYKFFEDGELPDSKTSYLTDFSSTYNAYVFSNIAQLLTIMKNEREKGAGVSKTESEAARNAKYAAWEAKNPDWNKVYLVPVKTDYSTTTTNSGISTKTLLRVRNDLGLSSVRIIGGQGNAITMNVVYSRFQNN